MADDSDRGSAASRAAQLAMHAPHLMRQEDVASLQATAGNKAVQRAIGQGQPTVQRELTFQDTDWSQTKYLDASTSGGGGVLFAGEKGREVVVKPGETLPGEGALAAYLISQAASSTGTGLGLAPGYRMPSNRERGEIKKAFKPLLGKAGQAQRVSNLVAKLDDPGLVIQEMAQGKQLSDVIGEVKKHTKKKLFGGGRKFRKEGQCCKSSLTPAPFAPWERSLRSTSSWATKTPALPVQSRELPRDAVQHLDDRQRLDRVREGLLPHGDGRWRWDQPDEDHVR